MYDASVQGLCDDVARKMADSGGDHILKLAVANTPMVTGQLRAGWRKDDVGEATGGGLHGYSTTVHNDVSYAGFVESGTGLWGPKHAPYLIKPKSPGGVLRWVGKDGQVVFARYALHPGSPGHYMLAIAMNVTEAAIEAGLFDPLLEGWAKECEAVSTHGA